MPKTLGEDRRRTPRDAVLDAAEGVILSDGIGSLTLDAAAKRAGVSKGGLLHHFPSKNALIDALVKRKLEGWRCEYTAAIERQPAGPGRVARAFMGMCLASTDKWTEEMRRSSLVLVAALVHDPRHVEPLREIHKEVTARLSGDGLPAGAGEAVKMAMDGIWFGWIFGITEMTPRRLSDLRGALERMVCSGCPEQSAEKSVVTKKKTAARRGIAAGRSRKVSK